MNKCQILSLVAIGLVSGLIFAELVDRNILPTFTLSCSTNYRIPLDVIPAKDQVWIINGYVEMSDVAIKDLYLRKYLPKENLELEQRLYSGLPTHIYFTYTNRSCQN